eukprot:8732753-Pyramimonas_sp.AAC.1
MCECTAEVLLPPRWRRRRVRPGRRGTRGWRIISRATPTTTCWRHCSRRSRGKDPREFLPA